MSSILTLLMALVSSFFYFLHNFLNSVDFVANLLLWTCLSSFIEKFTSLVSCISRLRTRCVFMMFKLESASGFWFVTDYVLCGGGADRVFGPATTTRHVYDFAAQQVVSGVMEGINGKLFSATLKDYT